MSNKKRIGILGIGGTGGFFGGKLAKHYERDEDVEIIFIARNETKRNIIQNGLKVDSVHGDFIIKPDLVSDELVKIGTLDILLVCVKSYSLENAVNAYKSTVKKGGLVITIQNLVNQAQRIEKILPEGVTLLEGCTYIISNIVGPGHIKHKGGPTTLFFGNNTDITAYRWVEDLFVAADIKATLSDHISTIIWKKFLFISPVAVATSYFSATLGELRSDTQKINFLRGLMEELFELIQIKNIDLGPEEIEHHINSINGFPENGKSSMQLDIEQNKRSEIDSLLDYVLVEAKKYNIELNHYAKAQKKLSIDKI